MSITHNYVPREYKTLNILLVVPDAHRALKFYNEAFAAEVVMKLEDPNGVIIHAEMKIDDTIIMLAEDPNASSGSGIVLQLYTGDAEALFESALKSGCQEVFPLKEQFYGDRAGRVQDPFGFQWIIATHTEDVPARELQKRFNDLYS
jgi:PhnB protein